MKNVSSAFKNELKNGNRKYIKSLKLTLNDGTELLIDNSKLWQNGLKIDRSTSSSSSFDIGSTIIGHLTLTLNNIYDEYTDYDFTGCVASNIKVGLELLDGTIESLTYGVFYLDEAKYNGSIITLSFYDSIYKFDKNYSESNLIYPATLGQIVRDACSVCGVTLQTMSFDHDDYVVQQRPNDESLTFRQVLQWVGQIACLYCITDEQGRLCMEWYDTNLLESIDLTEDIPDNPTGYHHIHSFTSLNTGLDDVVITGISVTQDIESDDGTVQKTYQSGKDGYVLSISKNKLIQGESGMTIASMLGEKIIGMRFRTFSASALSDPTIEAGDIIVLTTRKGEKYKSVVTNNVFHPGNFQNISCGAVAPARKSASRYSEITQVYVDYRKDLQKEKTAREKALEELGNRINSSSGVFTTIEKQEDGSNIYYLHNKPQLSESDIVWKMTAEAWGVSTDGGKTYNAGMTVDGDTIVRILTATGVNADWINSGAISIRDSDGNETFYADTVTGIVRINAQSFSLTGKTVEEIAVEQVNDFVENVYSPTITEIQSQLDGQIETWFYDYLPTADNYPASEWTTDALKGEHLGDLFYVVDNEEYGGQAYRWVLVNGKYKWYYIEDTAVSKALADAAKAQDTADQKRRVFVSQPYPPYDAGDLWVGDSTSEMMRCQTARATGSYVASDWIKAVKYTDDANLNTFINGVYADSIKEITEQLDKKAEIWYQTTDPSLNWTGTGEVALVDHEGNAIFDREGNTIFVLWEKEKEMHEGDLWYDTNNGNQYIYQSGRWEPMEIPKDVFDTIDGKAQIFVSQPVPPYDVGDLWFNSATSDIMTCIQKRESGTYNAADWEKRNKYTDDTYAEAVEENLNIFSEAVTGNLNNMQEQIDGKIETWYYNYQPTLTNIPASQWNTEEKRQRHIGDLFYWQDKGFTYRFQQSSSGYIWQAIQDSDITEALEQAAQAQDTADRKRQVFYSTPYPPYDIGDLWAQGANGDIMRCKRSRQSGSYVSTDWEKASKYTDDTAVNELDESLNQEGVFNRLTNNGTVQGLFLEDGDLYINATYIKSGTLTLGGTNNQYGKLSIRNASNTEIGRWDKDGVYIYGGEIYSNADDSEASIVGGRIYVSHTGTDLGQIGANFFSFYESYKGITFGLRTSGSYMAWGAQESSYGDYVVKLLYSSKNFSDFLADTLYAGCNMDFRGYYIQNAVIDGFSCKNSFKIPNNTDCNIYSDVNFHNWEIQNVKIDNLLAINGYTTENGTFPVVTSITNRPDGGINWKSGYVTIRDGIITSWPS